MKRAPWSRRFGTWVVAVGMVTPFAWAGLAGHPALAAAAEKPAKAGEKVDAATKKLMSAHGKFSRSLFKIAAQEYTDFLAQYPQHAEANTARYGLGVCSFYLKDFDKAIELLGGVLKDEKFEQRDEALAVLGHSHLAKEDHTKALAAFDELLAKFPQSKHAEVAALNRAQVLYLAGKYAEAAAASQKFLQQYPEGAERETAMYFLALSQRATAEDAKAAATLADMLKTFPESRYKLDATLLLGQSQEAMGKLDDAIASYQQVVATAPASRKPDGLYSLGVAYYKAGKFDEAAKQLQSVVAEHPASPYAKPAHLQWGLVQLAAGKTAEARQTLSAVVQADKDRAAEARYGLAQCDMADKKWDAARAVLDELAKVQPPPANLPQIQLDRAVCLMEGGKFEPAAAEFEQFRTQHPDSKQQPEAIYRQAFCLHKLAKYPESYALCQQVNKLPAEALKDSGLKNPALELAAENLFLLAKYKEASDVFKALAAGATDAKDEDRQLRYALRMGQAAYFQNDYDGAVALLEPLAANAKVAAADELRRAIFLLGDAQLQRGKHAEAAAALKKYLDVAKPDAANAAGQDERQEAMYKLALAQLRANDPAAEATLAQAVAGPADSPWVVRALFEQGLVNYKQKKPEQAAAAFTKVLAGKPPEELAAPATYYLGWVDYDAKKYAEAAAWGQMLQQYPKHKLAADAAFQQGAALQEAGQHEPALAALQKYVGDHPQGQHVAKARQRIASSMTNLKRPEEAVNTLTALAADPKAVTDAVLYDLAWAHRGVKDNKAAGESYRRLLKDYPESTLVPAAKTELAEFLYADKEYAEAAKLLESVLAAAGPQAIQAAGTPPKPEDPEAKVDPKTLAAATHRLGWCYDKLNQPAKAAATFALYAQSNPTDPLAASALLQAGLALAADKRSADAAKPLAEMLQKFPNHEQANVAMLKLGEVQNDAATYPAALQTFTQFLAKYPQDLFAYRAHFGVGWAQEQQKQYEAARAAYKKVIDTHNGETAARAQFQIGETYLAEGKFEEAAAEYLTVEDVYAYPKWSVPALLSAGRAFEQLKRNDEARQQYGVVAEKYKDAPEAALARQRLEVLKGA